MGQSAHPSAWLLNYTTVPLPLVQLPEPSSVSLGNKPEMLACAVRQRKVLN
jgi:hypothetical protein